MLSPFNQHPRITSYNVCYTKLLRTNPFNITQNINGGTQYLSEQLKAYDNNLDFALAAYNAGPGSVNKYNGVPPYAETQSYVKKVKQTYLEYLNRE